SEEFELNYQLKPPSLELKRQGEYQRIKHSWQKLVSFSNTTNFDIEEKLQKIIADLLFILDLPEQSLEFAHYKQVYGTVVNIEPILQGLNKQTLSTVTVLFLLGTQSVQIDIRDLRYHLPELFQNTGILIFRVTSKESLDDSIQGLLTQL